jgi:hypothetical protein
MFDPRSSATREIQDDERFRAQIGRALLTAKEYKI